MSDYWKTESTEMEETWESEDWIDVDEIDSVGLVATGYHGTSVKKINAAEHKKYLLDSSYQFLPSWNDAWLEEYRGPKYVPLDPTSDDGRSLNVQEHPIYTWAEEYVVSRALYGPDYATTDGIRYAYALWAYLREQYLSKKSSSK